MNVYGADAVSDYLKYAVNVKQVPGTMTHIERPKTELPTQSFVFNPLNIAIGLGTIAAAIMFLKSRKKVGP
jgi:hypothetical protein